MELLSYWGTLSAHDGVTFDPAPGRSLESYTLRVPCFADFVLRRAAGYLDTALAVFDYIFCSHSAMSSASKLYNKSCAMSLCNLF